ncbi:MAG: DUF2163 domain-containing protein [Bdellovibrionales bacterium]
MKTATTQLAAHIAGEATTLATCWKVTRKDGLVLGFTDHDQDLTVDSLLYQASTGYTRSAIHGIADLSVDNLDIESALNSDTLDAADLRAGLWDGAEVEIFLVNWATLTQGKIILKRGTIGQVELRDAVFKAELRGLTQALSQQIVELYTPDCRADLGDARCKISLAALTVTDSVTAASDQRGFTDTARTEADGYWSGGLVTWTSGANAGRKMEIRSYATHAFALFLPMPGVIAVGDTYSLQPGCDKSFATCKARYNNAVNFRGEPHVPGTDQTLAYPDSK